MIDSRRSVRPEAAGPRRPWCWPLAALLAGCVTVDAPSADSTPVLADGVRCEDGDVVVRSGEGWVCTPLAESASLPDCAAGESLVRTPASEWACAPAGVPPGAVAAFAGRPEDIPEGWLHCDGNELSRTEYAALFAAIGESHGSGDSATTFRIPDYRGRFLRGLDSGSGRDPDVALREPSAPGGFGTQGVGSVQSDAFMLHTHPLSTDGGSGNGTRVPHIGYGSDQSWEAIDTGNPAEGVSTETRPKNVYVTFMIKY